MDAYGIEFVTGIWIRNLILTIYFWLSTSLIMLFILLKIIVSDFFFPINFQVIKAFNIPDFFKSVFPMLHEICSQACVTKRTNPSMETSYTGTGNIKTIYWHLVCYNVNKISWQLLNSWKCLNAYLLCLPILSICKRMIFFGIITIQDNFSISVKTRIGNIASQLMAFFCTSSMGVCHTATVSPLTISTRLLLHVILFLCIVFASSHPLTMHLNFYWTSSQVGEVFINHVPQYSFANFSKKKDKSVSLCKFLRIFSFFIKYVVSTLTS